MLLFALAHHLHLMDGTYAIRSEDYPGCEGRGTESRAAREQFRRALAERVCQMIEKGEVPILYYSTAELASIFPMHCGKQIPAPDRLPGTFDYALIERVELSDKAAARLASSLQQRELDTAAPAEEAMFQMMAVFGDSKRAMIEERVKVGLAQARAQGQQLGRPKVDGETEEAGRQGIPGS
jgi:hypothetical protein